LLDLPAVEVKNVDLRTGEGSPHRLAFLPHATLVGWINDKEILIVENHMLIAYDIANGSRRKSTISVQDYEHVFLR
jgi:hypothetical protein